LVEDASGILEDVGAANAQQGWAITWSKDFEFESHGYLILSTTGMGA
jgi:hypothetical protein